MGHDVFVIGGSAGSFEVLLELVAGLPEDLAASLFVVMHTSAGHQGLLPELLSKRGPLPASFPLHQEQIEAGHIYVAPADAHLLVRQGFMEVVRAARENGHRPAVDPLFRSAAAAYRGRVVGIVLSGYQDCGTAGMLSIKAHGGVSVVQAPESARAGEMPRSVLAHAPVDFRVLPRELPELITRLNREGAGADRQPGHYVKQLDGEERGAPAELVCPICQGVLTQAAPGEFQHFRCHVGHAFTLDSLVREQSDEMERALWAAVRSLEEGAALAKRLRRTEHHAETRARFDEKARTLTRQADLIRQMLLHGSMLAAADSAVSESSRRKAEAEEPKLSPSEPEGESQQPS
ncbi:MAG: chemotaxis protein CheB [Myxococcaceae bacterium]